MFGLTAGGPILLDQEARCLFLNDLREVIKTGKVL
jgi:hypothetical protein